METNNVILKEIFRYAFIRNVLTNRMFSDNLLQTVISRKAKRALESKNFDAEVINFATLVTEYYANKLRASGVRLLRCTIWDAQYCVEARVRILANEYKEENKQ